MKTLHDTFKNIGPSKLLLSFIMRKEKGVSLCNVPTKAE